MRRPGGRIPWPESLTLVVAANLPDVDLVLGLLGAEHYLLWHRGLTHSVVGLPVLAVALAVLAHASLPDLPLRRALVLCGAGLASHLVLDLPTAWGTIALYPLSHARYGASWLFIIDPILWAILALGITAGVRRREPTRRRAAVAGLLLAGAYVLATGALHAAARGEARRVLAARGASGVAVFPRPLAPWRWQAVGWTADSLLQVSLEGIPATADRVSGESHGFRDQRVRDAVMTVAGQSFLWWSEAPVGRVLERQGGRTTVRLADRRFAGRGGGDVFAMDVELDASGNLLGAVWEGEAVFENRRREAPSDRR